MHIPFSKDTAAFIQAHLSRSGYLQASKDEALVNFLAEIEGPNEVFTPSELIQDLQDRDLHVIANHSSFLQTPYSTLNGHYDVLSYRSFGIQEEQFIW